MKLPLWIQATLKKPSLVFSKVKQQMISLNFIFILERYKIVSAKQLEKGNLSSDAGKIPASGTRINIAPPAPGTDKPQSRNCC